MRNNDGGAMNPYYVNTFLYAFKEYELLLCLLILLGLSMIGMGTLSYWLYKSIGLGDLE